LACRWGAIVAVGDNEQSGRQNTGRIREEKQGSVKQGTRERRRKKGSRRR